MALIVKKYMREEIVFAQELSDDELENTFGGSCSWAAWCGDSAVWTSEHCVTGSSRQIYEGAFPNCAATVEDGSFCWDNDACSAAAVKYYGMEMCSLLNCTIAWR